MRETAWPTDLSGGIKATLADENHSLIATALFQKHCIQPLDMSTYRSVLLPEEIMFYQDFGIRAYRPRISHYFLTFARHFDQYANSHLVRTVDIAREVVWC